LFCLAFKLLRLHHQRPEVFPFLQLLDLTIKSSALRGDAALVLLPQLLEVVGMAVGGLLLRLLLTAYLSLLDLAADVLLEESVVLLALLLGVCFWF
jgi:hypothetical protein